jgi:aminoglycoside phosphotransferase (APT) family kinase protein
MPTEHEVLIRAERPDAQRIQHIGAGDINDAVLVDDTEVFRFPKTPADRQTLRFEATILQQLAGKVSLEVPRLHEIAEDNSFAVFSYVAGDILKLDQILAFTPDKKAPLASALATFMIEVKNALSFEETASLRHEQTPHAMDDEQYYDAMLTVGEETHNQLLPLYKKQYHRVKEMFGGVLPTEQFVFHGDLHPGNLIFTDDKLCGVIDFGDCGPCTIYSELRQQYRMGSDVVEAIVKGFGEAFGSVDMDIVHQWAIMHEFSVLMRPESQLPNESARAQLARTLLAEWVGSDWNKL